MTIYISLFSQFYFTTLFRVLDNYAGCVKCPKGTQLKGNKCEFCSIGTFNPMPANKFQCERCEPGKTTRTKGSTHYTDCVEIEPVEIVDDNTYLIIIGAVVGFFVLLIIILWCICLYNKKRRREREDHQRALKRQKHARDEEDRRLRHEEMIRKREKERRKQESYDMNRNNMVSFNDEDDDQQADHQTDPPPSTKNKKAPQPPGMEIESIESQSGSEIETDSGSDDEEGTKSPKPKEDIKPEVDQDKPEVDLEKAAAGSELERSDSQEPKSILRKVSKYEKSESERQPKRIQELRKVFKFVPQCHFLIGREA